MQTTIAAPGDLQDPSVWTIILAAGEGERLAQLVQALCGKAVPKQFAVLHGHESLLQSTLSRALKVAPARRTVVVVPETHELIAHAQVDAIDSEIHVVSQPRNLGTGPGILLPLIHVLQRDPQARVVILPSDHHFTNPTRFFARVSDGFAMAERSAAGLCLVGVEADSAATDLGWIVARDHDAAKRDGSSIERFVEKPNAGQALDLFESGAVWNTFVMVGAAQAIWELAALHLPVQTALFAPCLRQPPERRIDCAALHAMYAQMPKADFSQNVLSRARGLGLVTAVGSGWSDLGTPERAIAAIPFARILDDSLAAGVTLPTARLDFV